MSEKTARKGPNLRNLDYSPSSNPLVDASQVKIKRRHVSTGVKTPLTDKRTGEVTAAAIIHQLEERDDAEFVKIFAEGVAAAYDLSKTAYRVFQLVIGQYEKVPMSGGFVDSVYLWWSNGKLNGEAVDMSETTFHRGLKELLSKNFLSPRMPSDYWINPNLFFKGDRVMFIKEYVRKKNSEILDR